MSNRWQGWPSKFIFIYTNINGIKLVNCICQLNWWINVWIIANWNRRFVTHSMFEYINISSTFHSLKQWWTMKSIVLKRCWCLEMKKTWHCTLITMWKDVPVNEFFTPQIFERIGKYILPTSRLRTDKSKFNQCKLYWNVDKYVLLDSNKIHELENRCKVRGGP